MKHIWEHKSDNTVYTYLGKSVDFYKYNLLPLPELDGNLMVSAINKMRERGDWDEFSQFAIAKVEDNMTDDHWNLDDSMALLFGSPSTFFRLMQECLDKHIIGGK